MTERLTKRNSNGDVASHVDPKKRHMLFVNRLAAYEDSGLSPEEVQKMARAKVEGRLVVLPVSIGSPIWRLHHPVGCPPFIESGKMRYCDLDWWGKNAFSTREEAEKHCRRDRNETKEIDQIRK